MGCQVSVGYFVPINRDQGCGQLAGQLPKAAPAMGLRALLKHYAVAMTALESHHLLFITTALHGSRSKSTEPTKRMWPSIWI